jgi:hypothetical protein
MILEFCSIIINDEDSDAWYQSRLWVGGGDTCFTFYETGNDNDF